MPGPWIEHGTSRIQADARFSLLLSQLSYPGTEVAYLKAILMLSSVFDTIYFNFSKFRAKATIQYFGKGFILYKFQLKMH